MEWMERKQREAAGPHAAVAKGLEPQVDASEWAAVHEGGDDSSSGESGETGAAVRKAIEKQKYNQFCEQQQELYKHSGV